MAKSTHRKFFSLLLIHQRIFRELYNLCQFQNNFGDGVFMAFYVLYIFVRITTLDAFISLTFFAFFLSLSLSFRIEFSHRFFLLGAPYIPVDRFNIKRRSRANAFVNNLLKTDRESVFTWFNFLFVHYTIRWFHSYARIQSALISFQLVWCGICATRKKNTKSNWPMHKLN